MYKKNNLILSIFYFFFLISIFYWPLNYKFINLKIITTIIGSLTIPLIFFQENINRKTYIILLFFIIHSLFSWFNNNFDFKFIFHTFYLIACILLGIFFFKFIQKYFLFILKFYVYSINIFIIIFFYFADYNFFNIGDCYQSVISENQFIYFENSHFALVSVPVLIYGLCYILKDEFIKNKKIVFSINYLIFLIFNFLNFSTTFLMLMILGLIVINLNKINYKSRFTSLMLIIFCIILVFNKKECYDRSIKNFTFIEKIFQKQDNKDNNTINNEKTLIDISSFVPSISFEVYLTSLKITLITLPENILGVGINNYQKFFKENITKVKIFNDETKFLNTQDASNNFSKILIEYGIFGCFFYLYFLLKMPKFTVINPFEIFLFISIIGQSFFRGVGYFNASFVLLATLFIMVNYEKNKKKFL